MPYAALPSLSVDTLADVLVVDEVVVAVPAVVVVCAASVGSFEMVLVMMIGLYPGAETVPAVTTWTTAEVGAAADPVADVAVTETSRIGAPRLTWFVAYALICAAASC